jgi:hypothetical protein
MGPRLVLLAALLIPLGAGAQPQPPGDDDDSGAVDLQPYAAALVQRFQDCLAEEEAASETPPPASDAPPAPDPSPAPGAPLAADPSPVADELEPPDELPTLDVQEELEHAMSSFARLLGRGGAKGPCTASDAAALSCAADVATWSCGTLSLKLEEAMTGGVGAAEAPAWSRSYAAAMGAKVIDCFTEESGAPPTAPQAADIRTYENVLAGAMGSMGSACMLDQERFEECLGGIALIGCDALADQISSDASITATSFMQSCEGFLDCGF